MMGTHKRTEVNINEARMFETNSTFNATDTFRGAGNSQSEDHSLDGRNIAIACVVMLGIILLVPIIVQITKCLCPDPAVPTPAVPKRLSLEERKNQIDAYLMIGTAEPHNSQRCGSRESERTPTKDGPGRQQKGSAKVYPSTQESFKSDTVSTPECSICFDNFQVGEKLAWSSNPECSHLYHYKCIKRWLLRHKRCPYCRSIFLLVDVEGKDEVWDINVQHEIETCLCVQHGIQEIRKGVLTRKLSRENISSNTVFVSRLVNQDNPKSFSISQHRGERSMASVGLFPPLNTICTCDTSETQQSHLAYQREWSA